MGAPKIYGKADLRKLADSQEVPLIAHSHEVIVPVVYSGMVKKFLESKGVKLPLKQSQLAEMKREAKAIGSKDVGYAKGTMNVQQQNQKVSQKVVIHLGNVRRKKGKGKGKKRFTRATEPIMGALYDSLRPSAWTSFRPIAPANYVQPPVLPDYKREADENLKRQSEALSKYRAELEMKSRDALKELEDKKLEQEQLLSALFRPAESKPVRSPFDTPLYSGATPSSPAYSDVGSPLIEFNKPLPLRSSVDLSTPEEQKSEVVVPPRIVRPQYILRKLRGQNLWEIRDPHGESVGMYDSKTKGKKALAEMNRQ